MQLLPVPQTKRQEKVVQKRNTRKKRSVPDSIPARLRVPRPLAFHHRSCRAFASSEENPPRTNS